MDNKNRNREEGCLAPEGAKEEASKMREWGQRDLNPRQRVSTTGGATSRGINESSLQLIINCQQTHLQSRSITGARQSARLAYTPWRVMVNHCLRIFASFFLLLIFFLRHFQRWLPRFFQAREPLFILILPWICHRYGDASRRARRDSNPRRLA
ncbi:hypothetical protein AUP07_0371 [methanogenic archaeon mixed culture ISO4-G1]|nr:hypothetical protein AUP07_0371 [methanogenic archaeon mixed culture ISO4-G1]